MKRPDILIVDDSSLQRRALVGLLLAYDCTIREAADGADALRRLAEAPADLILLDYNMPTMDGLEFLGHLRADAALAETPVVMLTANAAPTTLAAAARMRVRDYLLKPVDGLTLVGKLSRLIALRPRVACAPTTETPRW